MKCLFFWLFIVKTTISEMPLMAQVIFRSKSAAPESLRISHFNDTVRFTKPISNFSKRSEKVQRKDTGLIVSSHYPTQPVLSSDREKPSVLADRWQNVPSIPPLRVLSRKQYRISSHFGVRCHPITGQRHLHNGIDFPQPAGTPVYATADGYVRHVGLKPDGLGLSVRIEHSSGYVTTYGHLSRYEVQPGQWIRRGQPIGRVGQTGTATGPHLHYIVQLRGRNVDPMRYCFLAVIGDSHFIQYK